MGFEEGQSPQECRTEVEVGIAGWGQQGWWAEVGTGATSGWRVCLQAKDQGWGQGFQERGSPSILIRLHPPCPAALHLLPVSCLSPWKCCLCLGVTMPPPDPLGGISPVRPAENSREPSRLAAPRGLFTSGNHTGKCPNPQPSTSLPFSPCTFNACGILFFFFFFSR